NLSNNTIIIFTSDHGEEFFEHGAHSHWRLYDEHIHVPLIIMLPEKINKKIKEEVRLIDLTPTILDILNIKYDPVNYQFQGVSLIPLLKNKDIDLDIYSETSFPIYSFNSYSLVMKDNWKYIFSNLTNSKLKYLYGQDIAKELFDLSEDPKEKLNLFNTNHSIFIPIEEKVKTIQRENKRLNSILNQGRGYVETDKETLEKLKALGYIS
ncbi:MAG: sulfatase, partial [Candidatus Thorarchaeota archaeon]